MAAKKVFFSRRVTGCSRKEGHHAHGGFSASFFLFLDAFSLQARMIQWVYQKMKAAELHIKSIAILLNQPNHFMFKFILGSTCI